MWKNWKRAGLLMMVLMLSLAMLLAGCGATQNSEGTEGENNEAGDKTVNIGYVTWAENIAVTHLWKEILESKGYEVNIQQLQVSPLFVGLSKGDLDLFMDSWLPITHEAYWTKYKEDLEEYGTWYEGASWGLSFLIM